MFRFYIILFIVYLFSCSRGYGQEAEGIEAIKPWLMKHISALTDSGMHGRGYVKSGRQTASAYIQKEFKKYGLKHAGRKKTLVQHYFFPVNTFPGLMELSFNGKRQVPGKDYIIDAGSSSFSANNLGFERIDLALIKDKAEWLKLRKSIKSQSKIYYLDNVDSVCKVLNIKKHFFAAELPEACYIIPQQEKFIWTVSQEKIPATVFYIDDNTKAADIKTVTAHVDAEFIKKSKNDNIIGVLPGKVKDTFIAITAHYDHLGMMGGEAIFPGASDNASGTAMLLYFASYFSTHPQHYSMLFISFSGEEAGLVGSAYFTKHPRVPLNRIKFLTNIDIMGDATDGITVVNATEYPAQFNLLQEINTRHNYLPQVKSRGKAANSDHYHFSEAGVPSFFIYTNGGKGFYHDISDKANELSMNHIGDVTHLLVDFLMEIK